MAERITALFVKHIKRPGKFGDAATEYLQVHSSTRKTKSDRVTKSWIFRYSRFGKETWLGLGPYPDVTLAKKKGGRQSHPLNVLRPKPDSSLLPAVPMTCGT